jgi:transposase
VRVRFKKVWLFGPRGRAELFGLPLTPAMSHQRDGWLELLADLSGRVARLDGQLKKLAAGDERVMRLQTHPGIGLLTSLALVHGLEPVTRFAGARKVAAYVGFDPVEHSSAGKQGFLGISKGARGCCATCWWSRRSVSATRRQSASVSGGPPST